VAFAVPHHSADTNREYQYLSGIVLVAIAVGCLAIRWVYVQTLTKRYSPLSLLYLTQPASALVMLPFALVIDCDMDLGHRLVARPLWDHFLPILLVFGSAIAAMALIFLEYKIVHQTTSLTLSIAGIGKEVLTLFLSAVIFSESFTTQQIIAIGVSIVGILVYALLRQSDDQPHPTKSMVRIPNREESREMEDTLSMRTLSVLTEKSLDESAGINS
jgi:solute carrier family 35 protein C2